jgi:hypothetical protein
MTYTWIAFILVPFVLIGLPFLWWVLVTPHRRASVKRMREPVRATMPVTRMSLPGDEESVWQNGVVTGIVSIPGQPAFEHRQRAMIFSDKFPKKGDLLPIIIDRADPRRLAIQWDEIAETGPVQDGSRRD